MSYLVWILAVVLTLAGSAKLANREGFALSLRALTARPLLQYWLSWFVPTLELMIGIMLLIPVFRPLGALGALILCIAFAVIAALNLIRGWNLDCECFGPYAKGRMGIATLVRNLVLLLAAATVFASEFERSFWSMTIMSFGATLGVLVAVTLSKSFGNLPPEQGPGDNFMLLEPHALVGSQVPTDVARKIEQLAVDQLRWPLWRDMEIFPNEKNESTSDAQLVLVFSHEMCGDCLKLETGLKGY